jgi:secreted PhoX family phosphatase
VRPPQPIAAYGRFRHEAAAVDAATSIAYLTEDEVDGCFYRFLPDAPATPFSGRLQALRVVGAHNADTAIAPPGTTFSIDWVDVAEPDPVDTSVRALAAGAGAARVQRGEGLWLDGGLVYFASTTGGSAARGQILCLDPAASTLTILAEGGAGNALDRPDNLTVAPWGVVIAEDNNGDNHLRVLGADGAMSDLARNAGSTSEFAGPCFSPDGRILFVNLQNDGLTLAITGPFADAMTPIDRDGCGCC